MPIKINGLNTGSVTLSASATGGDVTLNLPNANGTVATTSYADTAPGLQHIVTQSFTAVSAVNVNNCFSSSYENYKINVAIDGASTSQSLFMRLRSGGVDNSSNNYNSGIAYVVYNNASAVTGANTSAQTWWFGWGLSSVAPSIVQSIDIYKPFIAFRTHLVSIYAKSPSVATDSGFGQGFHNVASSFDGFSFFMDSSTMSGIIRVYGYKN